MFVDVRFIMGLQQKFSDTDAYVLTAQVMSSNNKQASLSAVIASNNHLAGSSIEGSSAVNKTLVAPFPIVNITAEDTIGAALGNVGQEQTVRVLSTDGGGIP